MSTEDRIYRALILNDYPNAPYAEWVKTQKKTIETRMGRLFKYRGDVVICCGASNSVGKNAGRALCIVNIYDGRPMIKEDEKAACIEWHYDRKSLLLKDWRYFSRDFEFKFYYVSGAYQGIFTIKIPKDVEILTPIHNLNPHLPQMIPEYKDNPNGLHRRYHIYKTNGEPIDDEAEYFILRLDWNGDDIHHIMAGRKAIQVYAESIKDHLPELAKDLMERYGSLRFGE